MSDAASEAPATPPRPSAILILLRDGAEGLETLLLHRPASMDFGGTWAFPGGVVNGHDETLAGALAGDEALEQRLPGPPGTYEIAAIRECFEETGLLLARDSGGRAVMPGEQLPEDAFATLRDALQRGALQLAAVFERHRWRPAVEQLYYMNYWVTPVFRQRRYATRFFIAPAPAGQVPAPQPGEVQALRWLSPRAALEDPAVNLAPPTRSNLELLASYTCVDDALAWARARGAAGVEPVLPVRHRDADGERILLPGDPLYPERPEGLPDE